jgi:hypothetical protein
MVFTHRMRILRSLLVDCFSAAAQGEDRFGEAFGLMAALSQELRDASQEVLAKWLGVHDLLCEYIKEVAVLEEMAHYGRDSLLRQDESSALFVATSEALKGNIKEFSEDHPLASATQKWLLVTKPS